MDFAEENSIATPSVAIPDTTYLKREGGWFQTFVGGTFSLLFTILID